MSGAWTNERQHQPQMRTVQKDHQKNVNWHNTEIFGFIREFDPQISLAPARKMQRSEGGE